MASYQVFGQELRGFELLFTKRTFPDTFGLFLCTSFWILDKLLDLIFQHVEIVNAFTHLLSLLVSIFFDLLENSLSVLQLFIIGLNPQENRASLECDHPLIIELCAVVEVKIVYFPEIQEQSIVLFLQSWILFCQDHMILFNFHSSI